MIRTDVLLNGLKIFQDTDGFCFGVDAALLSQFADIRKKGHICDLCSGNGVIPLLLSTKSESADFTALEIQEASCILAEKSVMENGLSGRIKIVRGDVRRARKLFCAESFDAVTANPPYIPQERGRKNPRQEKLIARHEILCTLTDVVCAASFLLRSGGSFFMVHRPSRLSEIFSALKSVRLEPKRIQFVQPHSLSRANLVLIEARKNAQAELVVDAPVIVHG